MSKRGPNQIRTTHVDFHFLVKAIVHDQAMGHPYTVRLHGMSRHIGIVSHVGIVEVGDLAVAVPKPVDNGIQRWC